jgi:hypothetical protein
MSRRIFRESALRRYNDRLDKVELPRYATLPWTISAWLAGGGLLLFSLLLLAVRLPVYAAGSGLVDTNPANNGRVEIIAFLPAEYRDRLRPGQATLVNLPPDDGRAEANSINGTVEMVETRLISPADARQRFGLDTASGLLIDGPVVVARIRPDKPVKLWAGSIGEARIIIGERSGLTFLPGIGRFFE